MVDITTDKPIEDINLECSAFKLVIDFTPGSNHCRIRPFPNGYPIVYSPYSGMVLQIKCEGDVKVMLYSTNINIQSHDLSNFKVFLDEYYSIVNGHLVMVKIK